MTSKTKKCLAALGAVAIAAPAFAGTPEPFTPLDSPATVGGSLAQPWKLPVGFTASLIVDADTMEANTGGAFPDNLRNWDMIEVNPNNTDQIFFTNETDNGGVVRYNRSTGQHTILMNALLPARLDDPQVSRTAATFDPLDDTFVDLDGIRYTPYNTMIVGEEEPTGRLFEITNPNTATSQADTNVKFLDTVPAVRHEGMDFDSNGTLYFVDELNSGSIYKYVPTNANDLSAGGQTFVLVDDSFAGEGGQAGENWNSATNQATDRTGSATWVAITNADGTAAAAGVTANPFDYAVSGDNGGQLAADDVDGTPYGRPEDLHFVNLASGSEAMVIAMTSENIVYTVDLDPNGDGIGTDANIFKFVDSTVTPDTLGNNPVGSGNPSDSTYGLDDPDNLAIGPNGEVYIIEDETPADIWVATDLDNDGVAESVSLWASLGEAGSEATGLFLDPADPTGRTFLVNIQHPSTGNDALWAITTPEPTSAMLLALGGAALIRRRRVV